MVEMVKGFVPALKPVVLLFHNDEAAPKFVMVKVKVIDVSTWPVLFVIANSTGTPPKEGRPAELRLELVRLNGTLPLQMIAPPQPAAGNGERYNWSARPRGAPMARLTSRRTAPASR